MECVTSHGADVIVIGSGPNGLAAAIEVARAGHSVIVLEGQETIGGGARTAELTLPGFHHDVCSAVHPFAVASPFFRKLPLSNFGLKWIEPPAALAHPFDEEVVVVRRSICETAKTLGGDGDRYSSLMNRLTRDWQHLESAVMGPLTWPSHPIAAIRFSMKALRSARGVANELFSGEPARGLFAGLAAHGMVPLNRSLTAGTALVLGLLAHAVGWPVPRGGAQAISNALAAYLRALGGTIITGRPVDSLDDLPPARAILCDLSPKPLLRVAGHRFPPAYRQNLERYRYGPGVFKMDWALEGPIPWKAAACSEAATVHLGGSMSEIALSEQQVWEGTPPEHPYVLLAQPTLFDASRAPAGKHIAWAYCHVPNGSMSNMTERIESQIERYAPGFRKLILARRSAPPSEVEKRNPNYVGGDIASGVLDWRQFFTRPTRMLYSTPAKGIYICSAATPPGVGVHGMCGYFAAQRALRRELQISPAEP